MSYTITLIYPDGDELSTMRGELFLPGDPCTIGDHESGCSLCGDLVGEHEGNDGRKVIDDPDGGDHRGIIEVWYDPSGTGRAYPMEYVHLRCVMDSGHEYHSVGFITEAAELDSTGKHLKSA